ncbi:hypothetical protein ACEPAF_7142 [Sanghuangporus sanghuang]
MGVYGEMYWSTAFRDAPGSGATHLVALIPSLPKNFKSFVTRMVKGKKVTPDLLAHCRRELVQACWQIMLDDAFVQAWATGVVQTCKDAVLQKWYPWILAYSADLPEKFLMSCLRVLGRLPCPRCLIPANEIISVLGKKKDMKYRTKYRRIDDDRNRHAVTTARSFIYGQ